MNKCNQRLHLTILDDHSTDDWLTILDQIIIPNSRHPVRVIRLPEPGFNASALAQFEFMASQDGLVYSIEDDYLHRADAIGELLETYGFFANKFAGSGRPLALYPFDMPDNYIEPWLGPATVIHGPRRHWRTNVWSTNSMLIPGPVVRRHWPLFEVLAKEYRTEWGTANNIHEGTTIATMFRDHVTLLTPLPSIALHMQFEMQRDPYIDWKQWWDSVPRWSPSLPAPANVNQFAFRGKRTPHATNVVSR
jgi:hypothetical protein